LGFLVLGVIHKGSLKVVFKYLPQGLAHKFIFVVLDSVQPVVVSLHPSAGFLSSNATHEVGTLLERVASDRGASIHDHESLEGNQKIHSLASIAIEELWGISFKLRPLSSAIVVILVISIPSIWIPIRVNRWSTPPSSIGAVGVIPIIIIDVLSGTIVMQATRRVPVQTSGWLLWGILMRGRVVLQCP
jgi:hypothetical protein